MRKKSWRKLGPRAQVISKVLHALMVVAIKIDAKQLLAAAKPAGLVWHQVFITNVQYINIYIYQYNTIISLSVGFIMVHLCACLAKDTLASATSRQQQAEKMDQQSLEKLVAHVKGLERSLAVDSSPKLEKLCRLEAESRAQRQEKHQMELEALRTAKALNELL